MVMAQKIRQSFQIMIIIMNSRYDIYFHGQCNNILKGNVYGS